MMLQLGTSRFERLTPEAVEWFRRPGWIHLGDADPKGDLLSRGREMLQTYGFANTVKNLWSLVLRKVTPRPSSPATPATSGEVLPFYYEKGDRLGYADAHFTFVFSEHFFEHLFLDEAIALLTECHRVLRAGGVVRICVPDADLRRDYPPEAAGFPYRKMPFTHPEKHKTRWSIYSLAEALRLCGFRPLPLRFHDRHGVLHHFTPASVREKYPANLEHAETVLSLDYIQRPNSLIVDGIKD